MRIAREEIFGPVLSSWLIARGEAIMIGPNDTVYGSARTFSRRSCTGARECAASGRPGAYKLSGWNGHAPSAGYSGPGNGAIVGPWSRRISRDQRRSSLLIARGRLRSPWTGSRVGGTVPPTGKAMAGCIFSLARHKAFPC